MKATKAAAKKEAFTQEQMQACFDNVKATNWKDPINKVIDFPGTRNLKCLIEAVQYFTGSFCNVVLLENGKVRVEAEGYYAVEAAVEAGMF